MDEIGREVEAQLENADYDYIFGSSDNYDDNTRLLESDEIVHILRKDFKNIPTPNYVKILKLVQDMNLVIDKDPDEVTPFELQRLYRMANNYRWQLADIKKKFFRVAKHRRRIYDLLEKIIAGKAKGSNAEQRKAVAALELINLIEKVGEAEDSLNLVDEHIKTLEFSSIQLSQILSVYKIPINNTYLHGGIER